MARSCNILITICFKTQKHKKTFQPQMIADRNHQNRKKRTATNTTKKRRLLTLDVTPFGRFDISTFRLLITFFDDILHCERDKLIAFPHCKQPDYYDQILTYTEI